MRMLPHLLFAVATAGVLASPVARAAESCTSQSQMKPAERDALAAASSAFAANVQSGNTAALRGSTIAELQSDFNNVEALVGATSSRLKGASPEVEQIYLLDASTVPKTASGGNPDVQFFCTLNQSQAEADFSIPQLPPGRYAFAMVRMESAQQPFRLSFLLRQESGVWHLAGFYPKPLTANGHDGLWYWTEARTLAASKQPWAAWLYLQEAQNLLIPATFVSSTHIEKLVTELSSTAPPAISGGLSNDAPLVVKAPDGAEFRFTSLSVDDSLGPDKLDIAAHFKTDTLGDAAAARQRNLAAMAALLAAHPELRKSFHGVWVFADAPNAAPYATELAMADIH